MKSLARQSSASTGLVSVIIPNYNHGAFLEQRIQSVLNQTYPRFEIILLDDCSTDNSRDIMARFSDHPRVSHIVYNESNSGSPFRQWEKGIALANGEWIWIAESDDWCEPTLLQHLVEAIVGHEQCVISYCQSYCVIDNKISWQSSHSKLSEIVQGKQFIGKYLSPNPAIFNASMAIWKREKFDVISKNFTKFKFSGDWVFWIELAKTGDVCINGRLLNYFRKHSADVSTAAYASGLNFEEGLSILDSMFKEKLIDKTAYEHAYKKNYREFHMIANALPAIVRKELYARFRNPLTSRRLFYRMWLSAKWRRLKGRQ